MEISRERALSVQRRASRAARAASSAAGCADDLMRDLLEDRGGKGATEGLALEPPNTGKGSGGGLLSTLGPMGPPLSLSPNGPPVLVSGVGNDENPTSVQEKSLGIKRVEVREASQSGNPGGEGSRRTEIPPMEEAGAERASREYIGKGQGSGSGANRVEPGILGAGMGTSPPIDVQGRSGSVGTERYYIGDKPPGLDSNVGGSSGVGHVVNPFWSPGVQKEVIREVYGAGYEMGSLGGIPGSNGSTPQKVWLRENQIEMDPIELFRLRCLREAEEKFRQGLAHMEGQMSSGRIVGEVGEFQGSQSSFASVENHEGFVPAPPPGPPPPSPPKEDPNYGKPVGLEPPPNPPYCPPFPASLTGTISGTIGENPTESLRTMELPRLSMEASPLQFGDWLSVIDSLMGDLSYSSKEWWDMVRRSVDQCYAEWLNTGPLERFRLKPQPDEKVLMWPRTERRALSMLLGAIPEPIKEEIISSRRLSTDQVLYRLYITYQPGGASERTKLLQCITDAKCGSSLGDLVEWIRLWRRYVQRATELKIVLPDGLVLIGALSKCSDQLSGKSPQVAYRINLIRQHLAVDQLPTAEKILSYAEHLQAEAEELLISSNARTPSTIRAAAMGLAPPPGINQGDSEEKPPSPPKKGACKYWMGEKGCNKGDQCKFQHAPLDPQSNRCFNCSAVGHSRRDCPLKVSNGDPKRKVAKSSKSQGKGKDGKAGKGKGDSESTPPNLSGNGTSSSTDQTGDGTVGQPLTSEKVDGLLTEATSLLKSLTPEVKAVKLKRVVTPEGATGLLDEGATNALRRGTPQELAESETVVVELAHGSVKLKQHPITGTILTDHVVEPIVPLRGLIDLGFAIRWSSQGCEIKHPSRGTINCWLRNGCPVVSENHALGLIHDLEGLERAKRIPVEGCVGSTTSDVQEWWSTRFPEVPKRIWNFMRGQGEPASTHHLPWNRAQRRRYSQAKAIVIHLFAGEAAKEWSQELPAGVEMLTVDIRDGQNLHDASVWSYVWEITSSGRVVGIIGGPPCRTVSRMLEKQPGPRRLRSRDGPERFGFKDLSVAQQQKTDSDTALFLKQMGLYLQARESWNEHLWPHMKEVGNRVGFLLESPQDPKSYLAEGQGDESASFWAWPETKTFWEKHEPMGMEMIHFDQGLFGHVRKKPTTCLTNLPDMGELNGCRSGGNERFLEGNLEDRLRQTSAWSLWAPGLRAAIKVSLTVLLGWYGLGNPKLSKTMNIDQWKRHIEQGHYPYRRDCKTCVINMASGKPHRRREGLGSSAWTMAVDLVHMPKSKDLATKRIVRYALVATALVPVLGGESEKEKGEEVKKGNPEQIETVDGCWGEGMEEKDFSLEPPEISGEDPEKDTPLHDGEEGMELGDGKKRETETEDSPKEGPPNPDEENLGDVVRDLSQPLKVRHITLMEPVESRNVSHVIAAMNLVLTKMHFMGVVVSRIHSDRAKELLSKRFQSWVNQRNVFHSFTSGDDPQSNGHCESEVHQLKRRTRLLLHVASQDSTNWPQAMRYATEERLRKQLEALGTPTPSMLPYQSKGLVKRKRWHEKGNHLAQPFVEARVLCPSPHMTSGWLVQTTKEDQVLQAREAILPDPLSNLAQIQLEEQGSDEKPPFRLVGKQPMPVAPPFELKKPWLNPGGEPLDGDSKNDDLKNADSKMDLQHDAGNEKEAETLGNEETSDVEIPGFAEMIREDEKDETERKRMMERASEKTKRDMKRMDCKTTEKRLSEGAVVKICGLEDIENHLSQLHHNAISMLESLLDVVPVTKEVGELCGFETQWISERRDWIESDLAVVRNLKEAQTIRMCGLQVSEEQLQGSGEVLQTTTIPLSEVRKELPEWKEAMMKEYNSLIHETKAIEPIDLSSLNPELVEFVPGKLVTVRKAGPNGGKKKCRAVVCGNLLSNELDPAPGGLYASGADGVLIRATLADSVQKGWGIGTTDIRTAFLLAPRPRDTSTREVIVVPPRVMVENQVCSSTERWRVHHALYGFTSSPAHWAVHRDQTMATFKWNLDQDSLSMKQTEEGNLWKIVKETPNQREPLCVGHVIVYVDDIMVLSTDDVRESFFKRLGQEWKCAEVETVNQTEWLRFCGFELKRHRDQNSLMVGQRSYTAELLKRHSDVTPKLFPMPRVDGNEGTDEVPSQSDIKAAQGITGELLWLSGRSRIDISYAVSIMSRNALRKPKWTQTIGKHILGFLMNTPETCLVYSRCDGNHGYCGTLQIPRHEKLIEAFADISFNPQGERSHQGVIICVGGTPIQWEATRQAFHTMSTAESELVGYCEAATMLKSAEALMTVVHGIDESKDSQFEKVIYGDNSSALSILMNPDGGWRTRHLRLRSAGLRELLKNNPQNWKARHQKGTDLPADMLTKPIVLQRDWVKFWHFLGFHTDSGSSGENEMTQHESSPKMDQPSPSTCDLLAALGTQEKTTKIKVLTVLAAMTMAAAAFKTSNRTRVACATAAAACAGWLASRSCSAEQPSGEGIDSGNVKREEKNRKEESKNQRAIGLKKLTKSVEDTEKTKRDSQGNMNLRDQNEKWLKKPTTEVDPQRCLGIVDPQGCLGIVDPQGRLGIADPQRSLGFDGQDQSCGKVNVVGAMEHSDESVSTPVFTGSRSSVDSYHCPTGCPSSEWNSGPAAMDGALRVAALRSGQALGGPSTEEWELTRFWSPPLKKKDEWDIIYLERGWLVRSHGDRRVRKFHPMHRGIPINASRLEGSRITVAFDERGERSIFKDLWTDQPGDLFTPKKTWVGWTFLKVRDETTTASGEVDRGSGHSDGVCYAAEHSGSGSSTGLMNQVCVGGVELTFAGPKTSGGSRSETYAGSRGSSPLGETGYRMSSVVEKGKFVADQLPLPVTEEFVSPAKSSDEGWEKIDEE